MSPAPTPLAAVVAIDGQDVAETGDGYYTGAPTVLSGATVTWGRGTVVDQPDVSSCTFTVARSAAGASGFVRSLNVGRRVDLSVSATVYPDPTISTFLDPGFDDPYAPQIPSANAMAATTDGRMWLRARDPLRSVGLILAPAPFVPTGTAPDAWDAIPATALGQTWGYGLDVLAPLGAVVEVRPVLYAAPWAESRYYTILDEPLTLMGDGAVHTLAGTFTPEVAGAWVGLGVHVYPNGLRWQEVDPAQTWADIDPAWTWLDYGTTWLDNVLVTAPSGGTVRSVLVFSGRITDQEAHFDPDTDRFNGGMVVVEMTAQDFTADLANNRIGDDPWPVESMGTRVDKILTLAGTGVTADVAPTLAPILVSYRDVDSQPAAGLITELAATVDGVAWSATHAVSGPYYKIEDPAERASVLTLGVDGTTGLVVVISTSPAGGISLSSCDVLLDPVRFVQDVSDTSTRVDVTWLEQGTDDEGKITTTDRHVVIVDPGLEADLGQRGVSLTTQLQSADDATDVAHHLLTRVTEHGWRLSGVTWATRYTDWRAEDILNALTLLDGTTRIGQPLTITDLPDWTPTDDDSADTYVEGGTYTVDETGAWQFDLTISSTVRGTGSSVPWADLDPAWRWQDFDPGVSWLDLLGVTGP